MLRSVIDFIALASGARGIVRVERKCLVLQVVWREGMKVVEE